MGLDLAAGDTRLTELREEVQRLREEVQRLRAAADDHAADLMDEGKDAERAYGRVEAYDQILSRLSRMEAET
jgi:hypothetical protein